MADLDERFRSLSRTQTPDLWSEIERRDSGPPPSLPARRRALAVAVALLIAAVGVGAAALTFGGSKKSGVPGSPANGVANGPILYGVGGEGGWTWYSVSPDGSDRRVVFEGEPMRIAQIAWSPDGTRMAYQDPIVDERGIFVANADGSDAVRLTRGANDGWPSWSPDGTTIAFSSTRYDSSIDPCAPAGADFTCPTDIYTVGVDGSNIRRLTTDPGAEYRPAWSPQGEQIAFEGSRDSSSTAIYVMNADGASSHQVSSHDGGSDFSPGWSPDGDEIIFASIRYEDWGIWVVHADGSREHMIFGPDDGFAFEAEWSPDGGLIAFVGKTNQNEQDYGPDDALYVMRPDGTGITRIADAPGIGVAGDIAWQPIPVSQPSVGPSPPSSAEVVGTFPVGEDVRSVAYGEGSVWVAASNNDGTLGGRIIRIDPETHGVQAEISVDAIPTWEVGGGAMVFEDGDLWEVGDLERPGSSDDPGGGADAAVMRIDPATNEVVQMISVGGSGGADLTFLNDELWVLVFGDESANHRAEIVRINPSTGDVLARIPLETGWAHTIVAARGRIVVLESGKGAVNVGGVVAVIDPSTNAVSRTDIPSESFTPMPVASEGQVWIGVDPGFARFDPAAAAFPDPPVRLAPRFVGPGFLEADDRGIWFLMPAGGGAGPILDLFDPEAGEATELTTIDAGSPVAMAVAPNAIWILNYEGTLTHVGLG